MIMKYKYIVVYFNGYGYQADYNDGKTHFALHRACCKTKARAYNEAKRQIDHLNSREG